MRMSNTVAVETTPKAHKLDDAAAANAAAANAASLAPESPVAAEASSAAEEEEGGGVREGEEDSGTTTMTTTDGALAHTHHSPGSSPEQKDLQPEEEEEENDGGGGGGGEDLGCSDTTEQSEKADKVEQTTRKMLSRDSSQDYTDSTGIDLHDFLVNTLMNNPRDRITLLKLEQDLLDFISNNESQKRKFPPMTSYHRMLLHRVAAYFGMAHNVDPSGKFVVVNKTAGTRIPDQKFCDHIQDDGRVEGGFQRRYILKRDHRSFDHDDTSQVRMRLKADMRSKSMEEREEEYQRARDRIFEGDHLIFGSRSQDKETGMSTQQRRQIFSRQRSGRSGASWQSSSETEAPQPGDQRPWSSTDSSDSSHRPPPPPGGPPPPSGGPPPPPPPAAAAAAPPPAWGGGGGVTEAGGLSGVAGEPGVAVRGDGSASSKSTGRLSETGSESSSSVGSSSCPLPRPLLAPPPPRAHPACAGASHRHGGGGRGPKGDTAEGAALTGFYVLPLEAAAGMMPGGVLVNVHTGQPILGPDGGMHATPGPAPNAGRGPHQRRHPPVQPIHMVAHQQPANHLHAQADALSAHFGHMALTMRQPPDGCGVVQSPQDSHHCPPPHHLYHPHPHPHHQHQQQQPQPQGNATHQLAGYMVAGALPGVLQIGHQAPPPPPHPNAASAAPLYHHHHHHPYPGSTTPGPGGFQAMMSQSVLQQHAYIQPPVQQVNSCYCASTHYAHPTNQQQPYRAPPAAYSCPPGQSLSQHQAYHTSASLPSPAPGYQTATAAGLQPISSQQSGMGNQMQSVMVHYPPLPTYQQVSMSHAPHAVPQHSYPPQQQQQPVTVSCQLTQGGMAMQPCYGLLPSGQHHTTMSSTVSFLPVQVVEPLQYQPPAPSLPQHCTGVYPGAPATGMVVMQLPAPPQQHHPPPPRPHSPYQRKPPGYKLHGAEQQCPRRPPEVLQPPDDSRERRQSSVRPGSRTSTPALSVLLGHPGALQGPHLAPPTMPFLAHLHPQHHQHPLPTAFCPAGQGEACFPLVATPLHCKPLLRPHLLHTAPVVPHHQKGRHHHHHPPHPPDSPRPPPVPRGPLGAWQRTPGGKVLLSADLS